MKQGKKEKRRRSPLIKISGYATGVNKMAVVTLRFGHRTSLTSKDVATPSLPCADIHAAVHLYIVPPAHQSFMHCIAPGGPRATRKHLREINVISRGF